MLEFRSSPPPLFFGCFVLPPPIQGRVDRTYIEVVIFLILLALFSPDLRLIPIGSYASTRRVRKGLVVPPFDCKAAPHRFAWFFGVTTLLNVLMDTKFTRRAAKNGETPPVRGESLESRDPEFASYSNSRSSRWQRADWRDASKHKPLEEALTPSPSPVAI